MPEPTEDVIKREIAAARRILQSDRHASELKGLRERFDQHFPDNSKTGDNDRPPTPPATDPKEPPKPKASIWWGERTDGS